MSNPMHFSRRESIAKSEAPATWQQEMFPVVITDDGNVTDERKAQGVGWVEELEGHVGTVLVAAHCYRV